MTWASLALMAVVYLWFWTVAVHRIDDAPAAGVAHVFQTACGDFEHFYLAARALREGGHLYASGARGYIYPPLIALLFMPLTFVPVKAAALLMLAVNLTLVLLCTWVAAVEAMRRFETGASFDKLVLLMAATTLLHTGWGANLRHWATASAGLARLFGFGTWAATSANIDPITAGYSISVTSGVARMVGDPTTAWMATALVALVVALALRAIYAAKGKALIAWPRAGAQQTQPCLGTVALEWAALVAAVVGLQPPDQSPPHQPAADGVCPAGGDAVLSGAGR